ncbi:hypothetical protein AACW90_10430 [Vibrio sp. F74]
MKDSKVFVLFEAQRDKFFKYGLKIEQISIRGNIESITVLASLQRL